MAGVFKRVGVVAAISLAAAACASAPPSGYGASGYSYSYNSARARSGGHIEYPGRPLQCVAYARARSNIFIYGDAWTWWAKAHGRYFRSRAPERGAVMVLDGYAGPHRAHLAYVRSVVSSRKIVVDHANWLDRGNIHLGDAVMDVSPDNDWSEVRVFNLETHAWGSRHYHVRGFIGPGPGERTMRVASGD